MRWGNAPRWNHEKKAKGKAQHPHAARLPRWQEAQEVRLLTFAF
jgi:hypothetical protein